MDFCIRLIELPLGVKGVTVMDSDGFYNVYINCALSAEEQKQAIAHEICHISRGDFFSNDTLEEIESM